MMDGVRVEGAGALQCGDHLRGDLVIRVGPCGPLATNWFEREKKKEVRFALTPE